MMMCAGEARTLEASPPGGSFIVLDGPGALDGSTLQALGTGIITIEYEVAIEGCSGNVVQLIEVQQSEKFNIAFNDPELVVDLSGAQYQWVDCDNKYESIPDETNQSFKVYNTGTYALIVTQGTCIDTSECLLVVLSQVDSPEEFGKVMIVPNPSNGAFSVFLEKNFEDAQMVIRDLLGRRVWDGIPVGNPHRIDVRGMPGGLYLLEIIKEGRSQVLKLILEGN
jgi:hypothetical protein